VAFSTYSLNNPNHLVLHVILHVMMRRGPLCVI